MLLLLLSLSSAHSQTVGGSLTKSVGSGGTLNRGHVRGAGSP
jgi:hypothetical protein